MEARSWTEQGSAGVRLPITVRPVLPGLILELILGSKQDLETCDDIFFTEKGVILI